MSPSLILGWVFAGIVAVGVGIFAYAAVRLTPNANVIRPTDASAIVPYSITVQADGEASAAPDVAYVILGVDTPATTAEEATDGNARAMSAVIAAVKGQGIADKDVRTQDYSVMPVYAAQKPGESSPPTITGYRVRNMARVTVDNVQDVGKVLDAGLQAKANSAVNVSFAIKDNTALQQQALTDAVRQARAKAEAIAASAGVRLTGAYTITESGTQPPRPVPLAQPAAASAATPIEAGQLTINGHVTVVFQYAH